MSHPYTDHAKPVPGAAVVFNDKGEQVYRVFETPTYEELRRLADLCCEQKYLSSDFKTLFGAPMALDGKDE
jgi:hypothetical protein